MSLATQKLRILHIIPELHVGGAEHSMVRLLKGMDRSQFECGVLSLADSGELGREIRQLGIPLFELRTRWGLPGPMTLWRAARIVKAFRPDILQSWLYLGDLWAVLLGKLLGIRRILWNIRCSDAIAVTPSWKTRAIFKLNARLSRFVLAAAGNSQAGIDFHRAHAYHIEHWRYIPNGFETAAARKLSKRNALRESLGLSDEAFLIGTVSKFHPLKDYVTLIEAGKKLCEDRNEVHFILIGEGFSSANTELLNLIGSHRSRFHLLGERHDVDDVLSELDLFTLTSMSEGFPNALGEALAAGVPCVATDVGDVKSLMDTVGTVVPARDIVALKSAWEEVVDLDASVRQRLGVRGQERIRQNFSLQNTVALYENFYRWAYQHAH